MKLLLDIGNSRIKAALSAEGRLVKVDFHLGLFQRYPITQLTYASVRLAERNAAIIVAAIEADVKVVEVKTQAEAFGVSCAYDNYHTLGIDSFFVDDDIVANLGPDFRMLHSQCLHSLFNVNRPCDAYFNHFERGHNNLSVGAYFKVYTDGSFFADSNRAGIGIWFGENNSCNVSQPLVNGAQEINRAELTALSL